MTLHERLQLVFREVFEDESIVVADEMAAEDVPAWDSVAHVNLMFTIEQVFGVQFTDEQLTEFENVGQLKEFLVSQGHN